MAKYKDFSDKESAIEYLFESLQDAHDKITLIEAKSNKPTTVNPPGADQLISSPNTQSNGL